MLMKALMFVSLKVGHAAGCRQRHDCSDEVLLRLPNAIFGALTVIPLFLLTAAFFDRWTGLVAAAFWAVGINAITFNRIGKEDTLLVFFMLFAFYFYLRAKQTDTQKRAPVQTKLSAQRNFFWADARFEILSPLLRTERALSSQLTECGNASPASRPAKRRDIFLHRDARRVHHCEPAGAVAAGLELSECLHGRKTAGSFGLSLCRSSLQEQRVALAFLGHAHLFLSGVHGDQDSACSCSVRSWSGWWFRSNAGRTRAMRLSFSCFCSGSFLIRCLARSGCAIRFR